MPKLNCPALAQKKKGRPTKYSPDVMREAKQYLAEYEKYGDAVPYLSSLAINLNISRQTLYNWGQSSDDFLHILEQITLTQECVALNRGLRGEWNSNIVKLLLGKHGYHDKIDSTVSGDFKVKTDGSEGLSAALAQALGEEK